jgi:uncharacterized protein YndB with AHSA1/START domain
MDQPSTQTRSVVVQRELPFPPERIWRALTQPHLIEDWLMKSDFEPIVGRKFNLRRTPRPDLEIVIDCEVLEVEPNRTLSYTWSALEIETVVTFTLTPTGSGTLLRMEQSGFQPDQKQACAGATAGWQRFFTALEQLLARAD